VTAGMWETVLNRLASQQATIEELRHEVQTLRHYPPAGATPKAPSEFEAPDAPVFKGERKELLPFLAKCHFKFESQPSRFTSERSKVLYTGTHLEGPAFTWFQALFRKWPADLPSNLAPEEIKDWETFQRSLTQIYGDPNLEATSERELRRLRQTGSVSDYAAKFESLKQYLSWNDAALRDQFYLNLRDDVKDELAPLDRPQTLTALKELATRLDSRLEERRREHRHPTHPPSNPRAPNRPHLPPPAPPASSTPLPALRTPSHTTDGTVPMELDATGAWRLTAREKERRRKLGLCDYCGEKGHSVARCPVCPPPTRRFPARKPLLSFELEMTEKESTQE